MLNFLDIYNALDHERFSNWWLKKFPDKVLKSWPGIGIIKINGDRFDFDVGGAVAPIIPVCFNDHVIDLCAWLPNDPTKTYLLGGEGIDLNIIGLRQATIYQTNFDVYESPVEWLVNGCEGGCPLSDAVMPEYKALRSMTVDTPAMAQRMKSCMDVLCRSPLIRVVD